MATNAAMIAPTTRAADVRRNRRRPRAAAAWGRGPVYISFLLHSAGEGSGSEPLGRVKQRQDWRSRACVVVLCSSPPSVASPFIGHLGDARPGNVSQTRGITPAPKGLI